MLSRLKVNLSRPKVFVSVKDAQNFVKAETLMWEYDGESETRNVATVQRADGPEYRTVPRVLRLRSNEHEKYAL